MEVDQKMMKKLAEKAGKQALKFDWDKTVEKTVDFLFDNKKEKNV